MKDTLLNSMNEFTPELLYADITFKKRAYRDLALRYATEGNSYGAVHAAWASDVHTVQSLMWERVMVASPEPDDQFNLIAETVARALAVHAATHTPGASAREMVEQARYGMAEAFDAAAQSALESMYEPLDFLNHLPAPSPEDGVTAAQERLQGRGVGEVIEERRTVAAQSVPAAMRLLGEGKLPEAMQQAWYADWATFEAYLLEAAVAVGDRTLTTVDLRWALAVESMARVESLPTDFATAVATVRERLIHSLGTIEGLRLRDQFVSLH